MQRYKDFNGDMAYLRIFNNGSCRLTVYSGGKFVFGKDYKSERGAKIALGKYGDSFEQI